MINALFASQEGGTRKFTDASGIHFGWKAVMDLYSRECQRREKGHARMVPKLREAYVIRDSWTKLNVAPAKIMQVVKLYYTGQLYAYMWMDIVIISVQCVVTPFVISL